MNVTLALDRELLERARRLAAEQGISLNQMISRLLEEATAADARERLLQELEELWEREEGRSSGGGWTRDELHDRPVLR